MFVKNNVKQVSKSRNGVISPVTPTSILKNGNGDTRGVETPRDGDKVVAFETSSISMDVAPLPIPVEQLHGKPRQRRRVRKLSKTQKQLLYAKRPDLRPGMNVFSEEPDYEIDKNVFTKTEKDISVSVSSPIESFLMGMLTVQNGESAKETCFVEDQDDGSIVSLGSLDSNGSEPSLFSASTVFSVASTIASATTQAYVRKITGCAELDIMKGMEWTKSFKTTEDASDEHCETNSVVNREISSTVEKVHSPTRHAISDHCETLSGDNFCGEGPNTTVNNVAEKGRETSEVVPNQKEEVCRYQMTTLNQNQNTRLRSTTTTSSSQDHRRVRTHRRAPSFTDLIKATIGFEKGTAETATNQRCFNETPNRHSNQRLKTVARHDQKENNSLVSNHRAPTKRHRKAPSLTDIMKAAIHLDDQNENNSFVSNRKVPHKTHRKSPSITDIIKVTAAAVSERNQNAHGVDTKRSQPLKNESSGNDRRKNAPRTNRSHRRGPSFTDLIKSTIGLENGAAVKSGGMENQFLPRIACDSGDNNDVERGAKDSVHTGRMSPRFASLRNMVKSTIGKEKPNRGLRAPYVSNKARGFRSPQKNLSDLEEESTAMDLLIGTKTALWNAPEGRENSDQLIAVLDSFAQKTENAVKESTQSQMV